MLKTSKLVDMYRLASLLYSIIATSIAGALIVAVLVAGLVTFPWIIGAAALGVVAALPVTWLVARAVMTRTATVPDLASDEMVFERRPAGDLVTK